MPSDRGRYVDGHGSTARFKCPMAVAVDAEDNVYVADCYNQRIRMIMRGTRHVLTLAGGDDAGKVDGPGGNARFRYPSGVCLDQYARVVVRDSNTSCVRFVRTDLPWALARVLFVGLLKGQVRA
jgi:hypothetical protein